MNSKWTSFTKSRIAPCLKILSCLCQHSQLHVSLISANSDRREVVMRDCTTNYKKRINSRQSGIFTTSVTGLYHAVCYLFRTKTFFCIKRIPKKKGPVLLFKTIFWHWYCFPTNKIQDMVYGRTCMTRSGRSVQDHNWCLWIYEAGVILMVIWLTVKFRK